MLLVGLEKHKTVRRDYSYIRHMIIIVVNVLFCVLPTAAIPSWLLSLCSVYTYTVSQTSICMYNACEPERNSHITIAIRASGKQLLRLSMCPTVE